MDQFFDTVQKKRIYNLIVIIAFIFALFLASKTINSLKENSYIGRGDYAANVISVSGTGEVITIPDIATFSFSVIEEGKTVREAQDKASKKINAIIDALKDSDIEEKDIKTTGYNSYPKYEYSAIACTQYYCPPGRQTLVGYEVSQSITVKVRKVDDAGDVLTKVGGLGASNISGLDFVIDDIEKVQAEARDKAVADAREKAKILAKSLDVKLVRIISFNEGGSYPPILYGMGGMEKAVSMDAVMATPPQLPTGENKIVSNVTITYEIK